MDEKQLEKDVLEGCVLAIISKNETFGYQIIEELVKNGFNDIKDGALYPILTKFDKMKLVTCRNGTSPFGVVRKYYTITKKGNIFLENFKKSYFEITERTDRLLFPNEQNS